MPLRPSSISALALGASALTTATPDAIASRTTLPKASVVLGLSMMSALATARARSEPSRWPVKVALPQRTDRLDVGVDAFLEHQPAEEEDGHVIVRPALGAPPFLVPARGVEQLAVDPAAPQGHAIVAPQFGHFFDQRGIGHEHAICAAVEAALLHFGQRREPAQAGIVSG